MATAVSAPGERPDGEKKANIGSVFSNSQFWARVNNWLNAWLDVWHFDPELEDSPAQSRTAAKAIQMSHAHSDPLPINDVLAAEYEAILGDEFTPAPPGADPRLTLP